MATMQPTFDVSEEIKNQLLTGDANISLAIRNTNNGQIEKMLPPIDNDETQPFYNKVTQLAVNTVGIAVTAVITIAIPYMVRKVRDKKLKEFNIAFKTYADAIRNNDMNVNIINELMTALENLKKHKNYEKIDLHITVGDVEQVIQYTNTFIKNSSLDAPKTEFDSNKTAIDNLLSNLSIQKKFFEYVA